MSFYEEEKSKGNTLKAPQELHDKLDELAGWPENWNSYGALPIESEAIARAHVWMETFLPCSIQAEGYHLVEPYMNWTPPSITGDADGSVVFWWRQREKHLELWIYPNEEEPVDYMRVEGSQIDPKHARIMQADIGEVDHYLLLWYWLFS